MLLDMGIFKGIQKLKCMVKDKCSALKTIKDDLLEVLEKGIALTPSAQNPRGSNNCTLK